MQDREGGVSQFYGAFERSGGSSRTSRYLQMRTQFFYTHRWRVKSIVLWDNCHTTPGASLATRWEA